MLYELRETLMTPKQALIVQLQHAFQERTGLGNKVAQLSNELTRCMSLIRDRDREIKKLEADLTSIILTENND